MRKTIAFFDFDGTITTKDTLLEFIKYSKGKAAFYWGFLINSHYLLGYKLKIISNQTAKEKILSYFFRQRDLKKFNTICEAFVTDKLPSLLRNAALEEIKMLQQSNVAVVVVSASPRNWIEPWTKMMQIDLIATELEVGNNELTGKLKGKNCYGEEKVNKINSIFSLTEFAEIYAYGDSSGDRPMLSLAHKSYYKPFRN